MPIRAPSTPESRRAVSAHSAAVRDHGTDSTEASAARLYWRAEWWIALFTALTHEPTPTFDADQRERFAAIATAIPALREVFSP